MITYLPYLSLLIVNTIYLFSALLYAKAVPKKRVYTQHTVYQLYNQKTILLCYMLNPFQNENILFLLKRYIKRQAACFR